MSLTPILPEPFGSLDLSNVQADSLRAAAERMAAVNAPVPESVRQDTAGTVHLTWFVLGCRIILTLSKGGAIASTVTMSADSRALASIAAFQVQLQEFFAI